VEGARVVVHEDKKLNDDTLAKKRGKGVSKVKTGGGEKGRETDIRRRGFR